MPTFTDDIRDTAHAGKKTLSKFHVKVLLWGDVSPTRTREAFQMHTFNIGTKIND